MSTTYTNVTQADIEEFLGPQYKQIRLDRVRELVYARRVDRDGMQLSLRVFTGIEPDGISRDVGTDAIRCVLIWRNPKNGETATVATSKRVHRVAGWRRNLQARLDTLEPDGPRCEKCGAPMVLRTSKRGPFYGCAGYPNCKHTAQVTR